VFTYQASAAPQVRAWVRHRLKAYGAIYLARSVAVLPISPRAERLLRGLRNHIRLAGGSAYVLRADMLAGGPTVAAAVSKARDQDYRDIITACRRYLDGIDAAIASGRLGYVPLAWADWTLTKLGRRYERLRARDEFGASQARRAAAALDRCREALDRFSQAVYQADEESSGTA
jgi:hypothetical protein